MTTTKTTGTGATQRTDVVVRAVADLLPFPSTLDADMGGTFYLQIDLGNRGGQDDPHDRAGIEPDSDQPVWWIDINGGEYTLTSEHGIDTDPTIVAQWIGDQAVAAGCPAATRSEPTQEGTNHDHDGSHGRARGRRERGRG